MKAPVYSSLSDQWLDKKQEFLDTCTLCGACMEVCPTIGLTTFGKDDPIKAAERFNSFLERGSDVEAVQDFMSACIKCGYCGEVCPLGNQLPHMIRDFILCDLESAGYGLRKTVAELPENPESVYRFFAGISPKPQDRYEKWLMEMPANPPQVDTVYFPSCSSAGMNKRLYDMLDIFEKAGTEYIAPSPFDLDICCGCMHLMAGYIDRAEERARRLVDVLSAFNPKLVVTGCPHSYWWLRDYVIEIAPFDFKVQHQVQFIADNLDKLNFKQSDPVKVAYHDSCGIGRWAGEYNAPRKILNHMPGVTYVELPRNRADGACCGLAAPKELQDQMICDRLSETSDAGAEVLTSVCLGCVMGFKRFDQNYKLSTKNIINYVAEGIGSDNEDILQKYIQIGDMDKIIEEARPHIERSTFNEEQARRLIKRYLFGKRTLGIHDE